jgi:hypothetical protein
VKEKGNGKGEGCWTKVQRYTSKGEGRGNGRGEGCRAKVQRYTIKGTGNCADAEISAPGKEKGREPFWFAPFLISCRGCGENIR